MTFIVPKKSTLSVTNNSSIYTVDYFNSIISSNAVDAVNAEWDNITTYTVDTWVKITGLKRLYRCTSLSSTGEYPPANPTTWVDYGAINSFRLFDDKIGSQTEFTTSMTVVLEANRLNTMSFLNLTNVTNIIVTQTDLNTNVVTTNSYPLVDYGVLSLYDYFFAPLVYKKNLIVSNLAFSTNATISVTFESGGIGYVGAVVSGLSQKIGLTLFGTRVKMKDYSEYTTDKYGNTSFIKRGYARIISGQVLLDSNLIDDTINKLVSIRGGLTLFIADDNDGGYESLTTLGYIETIEIEPTPTKTKYPITIIGVT